MPSNETIERLTLEEKASLLSGEDFWQTTAIPRLGIPAMFLADGPHGLRRQSAAADHLGLNPSSPATCFPTAATVANSWNVHLGEQIGKYLGIEAALQKVNVVLGPGLNIKRNPLCGRNFEYFSEDPLLAGRMAAAYVRGIQDSGVSACVKHFAANNQETARMNIDAVIDERTLREIYLTGFEIAVKEGGTRAIMSAYNRINGVYANDNLHLMREILRGEWGFTGVMVTDWGGSNDRIAGLKAGNDLEMPGTAGESDRELIAAVRAGTIPESLLDESVDRLIELASSTAAAFDDAPEILDEKTHNLIACKAAEDSIVLLKNRDGILPLDTRKTVAVIGEFARHPRYQGAGSSNVNPTRLHSTLDKLGDYGINSAGFEPGFERYGRKNKKLLRKAAALARKADIVLLYVGLDEVTEAEGIDRKNIHLPENQTELIDAVSEANPNVIAILSCGSVVDMPWLDRVAAVLHGYLGGQAGAEAMLRIITGMVNPSGKLAESYPLRYEDVSSAENFPGGEATVEYREGLFTGYRHFDRNPEKLLFPFGFGLSYTTFEYGDLRVGPDGAELSITNTGKRAGCEVVQLYVGHPSSALPRPLKELKGFTKVFLESGERRRIKIPFDEYTFRFFDAGSASWKTEAGTYTVLAGASSQDIRLEGSIEREGITVTDLPADSADFETLLGRPVPPANWDRKKPLGYNDTIAQCRYARGGVARFAYRSLMLAHWFLWKTGRRSAANLIMMSFYNMPFRGIAKMMGGMITLPMVDGLLLVVNGHFFKGTVKFISEYLNNRKEKHAKS